MANLDTCETMVRMVLKDAIQDQNPTEADITSAIEKVSLLMPMTDQEKKYVEKILQSNYRVRMDLGNSVVKEATYHPWIAGRKANVNPYYWNRYRNYLLVEQGWNETVVDTLGEVSDEILDLCGNPSEEGIWQRKGLVLGDVQSGKTSNYLALCNKAADYGYKVIILLTGTIESLRKQTQERVDSGFVGLNSRNVLQKNPEKKYVGVGAQDSNRCAYQFTSVISDFNMSKLQASNLNSIKGLPEPVILVLKKNKSILENLSTWLKTRNTSQEGEKIDLPLLLIDDEADNASVNTNNEDKNPTAINAAIVEVLKLFNHSSYVAVTATPYANIFIDSELDNKESDEFNLFPSDFIYALSAPTNYIGARQIFNEDGEYYDSLEPINDVLLDVNNGTYVFRSKAKSNHTIPYLPQSLKKSIKYFLLVNAVRDLDGKKNAHRSMLINVSQFVNVQIQVYEMVTDYLKLFQTKIQSYSKLTTEEALKIAELNELFELWKEFELYKKTGYTWEQVQQSLYEATASIKMSLVNQKAKEQGVERLDYEPYKETGLRVIAVGGNSLSRGLTLEGLCVSYFDRNSQMYDTLMQMGRWFGYRKGYENLFKIWMEPDAINWYQYISNATDELREDIREMNRVGLTPSEFGLKVKQNMNSLFVTARNKMRATTVVEQWVSLAAEVVETPRLIASREKCLDVNLRITKDLLTKLEEDGKYRLKEQIENRVVYCGVDKEIISRYIENYVSHPSHIPFSSKELSEHIKDSATHNTWTVAVIGGSGGYLEEEYFGTDLSKLPVQYSKRVMLRKDNCLLVSGQRARVGVPGATKYGLTKEERDFVEQEFKKLNPKAKTIPDKPYLRIDRDPILLIYLIKVDDEIKPDRKAKSDDESISLVGDLPVIGLGLGFPGSDKDQKSEKVKYVLNSVGSRELYSFEFDDEDEDDEAR